jgi:HSP20 family molecular chaperone IbpA
LAKPSTIGDFTSYAATLIGLVIIGFILLFLVRVQRGLLGVVLAVLAGALLLYWLRQFRRAVKGEPALMEPSKRSWLYDLVEDKRGVVIIADVPGPANEVNVWLEGQILHIQGGGGFKRQVKLKHPVALKDFSYVNGVLQVRLQKVVGELRGRAPPDREDVGE